jgi:hypothetical protein
LQRSNRVLIVPERLAHVRRGRRGGWERGR